MFEKSSLSGFHTRYIHSLFSFPIPFFTRLRSMRSHPILAYDYKQPKQLESHQYQQVPLKRPPATASRAMFKRSRRYLEQSSFPLSTIKTKPHFSPHLETRHTYKQNTKNGYQNNNKQQQRKIESKEPNPTGIKKRKTRIQIQIQEKDVCTTIQYQKFQRARDAPVVLVFRFLVFGRQNSGRRCTIVFCPALLIENSRHHALSHAQYSKNPQMATGSQSRVFLSSR